jgi:hypothetical protein
MRWQLDVGVIEKDYVLGWVLAATSAGNARRFLAPAGVGSAVWRSGEAELETSFGQQVP